MEDHPIALSARRSLSTCSVTDAEADQITAGEGALLLNRNGTSGHIQGGLEPLTLRNIKQITLKGLKREI